MNLIRASILCLLLITAIGCTVNTKATSSPQLVRQSYSSLIDQSERDFFIYLPRAYYSAPNKDWPVLLFLHGNGERGNGKTELGYVIKHGPIYEAWIQKKDLPFIIISPQLPMFGWNKKGVSYIDDRTMDDIPMRLESGIPARAPRFGTQQSIVRRNSIDDMTEIEPLLPQGWELVEEDVMSILNIVLSQYNTDKSRVYLSGLSYGGFGTWYLASQYPEHFAAIAPVVGWGHPELMRPIAMQNLPVWAFAGGRDSAVDIQYFYAGLEELERLGHNKVRFTVHEDMEHDAWVRVYAGDDIYNWMLSHRIKN